MPLSEHEFLSTFVHELLNSLNGISSIAKILHYPTELGADEIEESASDLALLTSNANDLIGKLRAIISTQRVLNSKPKDIKELCKDQLPRKGQFPSSLQITFEGSEKNTFSLPSILFEVYFDSLLYILMHSSDDTLVTEQEVNITPHSVEERSLSLTLSNSTCISHLNNLNKIDPNLVKGSRYGFELKMLSFMLQVYHVELNCESLAKYSVVNIHFNKSENESFMAI